MSTRDAAGWAVVCVAVVLSAAAGGFGGLVFGGGALSLAGALIGLAVLLVLGAAMFASGRRPRLLWRDRRTDDSS